MFSLQTIFGSGKQFYWLLNEAAQAAYDSTNALHAMMRESDRQPALDAFKLARLRERAASDKIGQALVDSFMTPSSAKTSKRWARRCTRFPSRSRNSPTAIRWPPSTWNISTSLRAPRCWSRPPVWSWRW